MRIGLIGAGNMASALARGFGFAIVLCVVGIFAAARALDTRLVRT